MTDSTRLNYLDKKIYTVLTFDNATKTWYFGDEDNNRIFSDIKLRRVIDKAADYTMVGVVKKDEYGLEINDSSDYTRLSFLNNAFFNLIKFDKMSGQWMIGDRDTNIAVSINFQLRKAVDKLLC